VQSIDFRLLGKWNSFEQVVSKVLRCFRHVEDDNVGEKIKAILCSLRITRAAFGDYSFRNEQIVFFAVVVPPIPCELLIASGHQITAWT